MLTPTHSFKTLTQKPVVLSISGSDSAAMAGVQMDNRSCQALSVHCVNAITAVTAQNNHEVIAINAVSVIELEQQIQAVLPLNPQAIKIGMLASTEQIDWLSDFLAQEEIPVIYDPVLATSSFYSVANNSIISLIKSKIIPHVTIITPNLAEAQALTGISIHDDSTTELAAIALQKMGCQWVIITGGHRSSNWASDFCAGPDTQFWLHNVKLDNKNLRGSGCFFASTLAATIARGYDVRDALVITKMCVQNAIENALKVNGNMGCLEPNGFPTKNWPEYSERTSKKTSNGFAIEQGFPSFTDHNGEQSLGLYPIVDRAVWLERLLPLGVSTIQLRIKDLFGHALVEEITQAITIAKRFNCRLFINDYWQLAIELGAYGVHLGQEDLANADLLAIKTAGLRLGISTHSHWEVVHAKAFKPSYIACGPIFPTTTKTMPWVPHGIEGLNYWRSAINDYPLVAIAGIDETNFHTIAETGVSGIALITAITKSPNPEATTQKLLTIFESASEKISHHHAK
ncbi:thiamine phosphate synthase [Sessilibacter sp. MAH1]